MGIFKMSTNHNETTGLPWYSRSPPRVAPDVWIASAAGLVLGLVLGLGLVASTALYAITRLE